MKIADYEVDIYAGGAGAPLVLMNAFENEGKETFDSSGFLACRREDNKMEPGYVAVGCRTRVQKRRSVHRRS